MVIILSAGLGAATMKIVSMDKKIENNKNLIISQKPELLIKEKPVIEEKPPIEKEDPIVEDPPKEEPPKIDKPNNPPKVEEPHKVEKVEEPVIVKPTFISSEEAIKIGKNKVGAEAKLIKIEADLDDNPPKYNIELVLGDYEYELEIHAITGAVIDFERDEIDD
jgi:uncharacterized membrane protein YkoI